MTDTSSEKQYDASSKRIEDLKKKGQVIRSRDLSGGLVVMVSSIMIVAFSSHFEAQFRDNFTSVLNLVSSILYQQDRFGAIIQSLALKNFWLLMPIFVMSFVAIFLSVFLFGGWNFSIQVISFNWEKLNPVNNLGNLFSSKILIEIFKSILKFSIFLIIVMYFFSNHFAEVTQMSHLTLKASIYDSYSLLFKFVCSLFIGLMFIVAADIIHQYKDFNDKNKMTFQELKDEQKESDGNPENKRRQRSVQFSLMKQRLAVSVPKADVIITNPTHYAVALRYHDGKDRAPKVVAKGKDYLAMQIRQIATSHGIPIYPAPPLARAIYNTAKLGTEIHPELYMAVAVVLSYVHQLKRYQQGYGPLPVTTSQFNLPERFIFKE